MSECARCGALRDEALTIYGIVYAQLTAGVVDDHDRIMRAGAELEEAARRMREGDLSARWEGASITPDMIERAGWALNADGCPLSPRRIRVALTAALRTSEGTER